MSLYSEYLDAKSELLSKDLAFKTAVGEWFDEQEDVSLIQPIDVVDSLTMDHFTISVGDGLFCNHLKEFEKEFQVKCIRVSHQEILTPGESIKHVWKFHFRESKDEVGDD